MVCLGVVLLESNLLGILWASWTCMSIFFTKLRKFSFIIISNKFSISCSSYCPSDIPMIQMLEYWKFSHRFLSLSSFFWILISSFCSHWVFISSFCSKSLIWVPVSFPSLLVPCIFCFISLCIAFSSFFILRPYSTISVSMLITSVLHPASDRLAISLLLSSFSGVLICCFIRAIFLCLSAPVML